MAGLLRPLLVGFICTLMASGAFAELTLLTVSPGEAPFNRPTRIVLGGDFDLTGGMPLEVFLAASAVPAPETDVKAFVVAGHSTSIEAYTPRVPGPAGMYVYVRQGTDVSNLLAFSIEGSTLGATMAARAALLDAFEIIDSNVDGALSYAEASAFMRDLTTAEFDALDANGDASITANEVGPVCSCVGPGWFLQILHDLFTRVLREWWLWLFAWFA